MLQFASWEDVTLCFSHCNIGMDLFMVGINSCHFLKPNDPGFLYCHPPPEPKSAYGSCGDCHCINGDKPCPSDPNEIPLTNVPDDWLKQLKRMEATNPYQMVCNPYNTTDAIQKGTCTNPPQNEAQLNLWETAACGITYDMNSLDADQCPTKYSMKTYDSEELMLEAGAEMTHWGAVRYFIIHYFPISCALNNSHTVCGMFKFI